MGCRPWEILYDNDLVIAAETLDELNTKLQQLESPHGGEIEQCILIDLCLVYQKSHWSVTLLTNWFV